MSKTEKSSSAPAGQGAKSEQKNLGSIDQAAIIAALKASPELANAVKAELGVTEATALKSEWGVQLNKYGDIHFKKDMVQSLKHFAGLNPQSPLKMSFSQGTITIVAAPIAAAPASKAQ